MHFKIVISLLALTGLVACHTPELVLDPSLSAGAMPVKGRNGLQIGQVIRYGDYTTDKVRRGWTKGYDIPFILRFQGAKEKLSFAQFGPENTKATVACISKFKSTEIELVRDFFGIQLDYQNYFAGNITVDQGGANWDFILHNPNGDFLREKASAGFIRNGEQQIAIEAIRGLKGQPDWMKELTVYGHEFRIDNAVVGAVSTINKGTVWIDERLDAETRTVIAAVATGLLLRRDMEDVDMQVTR
ncbi:MAG: hypothetical protein H6574_23940 [Lewinellaceae bacterium]|nr:hypothetical protein [Saprospiraceae bacterium]MCB9334117.1 hypothetical protein [Lewinellaceae bacterium]